MRGTLPLKGASLPKSSSEDDDIAMQKAKAKREVRTNNEFRLVVSENSEISQTFEI